MYLYVYLQKLVTVIGNHLAEHMQMIMQLKKKNYLQYGY